jgi:SAM-dependent methyltransferase
VSLPTEWFDRMYAAAEDPWGFRERWYEKRKYALSLAVLPRPLYRRAFEPGCSVGVLTALLADRCEELLAWDPAGAAVRAATAALARHPTVTVTTGRLPVDRPPGRFDLVVFSEVGYYLDPADLESTLDLLQETLEPGGDLLAVHWRPQVEGYPSCGDAVHAALHRRTDLELTARHVEDDFLLEVRRNGPARSVAQDGGLR